MRSNLKGTASAEIAHGSFNAFKYTFNVIAYSMVRECIISVMLLYLPYLAHVDIVLKIKHSTDSIAMFPFRPQ